MNRRIRAKAVVATVALVMAGGTLVLASPAQANHIFCGAEITVSSTLPSDLGPCSGNGLVVAADNITLDLGGHRIFADNGPPEQVGILLDGVSGVTVRNGTVEGFDAGIAIEGGGGNTVRGVTAQNNVNDLQEPFDPTEPLPPDQLAQVVCIYGDGITTFDSDNNRIEGNRVLGNGPYSGISLVGDSDSNVVQGNQVTGNDVPNIRPNGDEGLCGAVAPGSPGMQRGRTIQDIGVRVEGPGAVGNRVEGNRVVESALVGISVHSYVCNPPPDFETGPQDPNVDNLIRANDVSRTGEDTVELDSFADGISLLAQGPIGRVTCAPFDNTVTANRSTGNLRNGISLGATTTGNMISANMANDNAEDGIRVANRASENTLTTNKGSGNDEHDGHDDNPNCDANTWQNNMFGTVNQSCVGMGTVVGDPPAGLRSFAAPEDNGRIGHTR